MTPSDNLEHLHVMAHHIGDRIAQQLTGQQLAPAALPVWRARKGRHIVEVNSGRWRSYWGKKTSSMLYPMNVAIGLDGMLWVDLYWETEEGGKDLRLWPVIQIWNRTWQEYQSPMSGEPAPMTPDMRHLFMTVDHAVEGNLLLAMSYHEPTLRLAERAFPPEAFERLRALGWTGNFEADKANGVNLYT